MWANSVNVQLGWDELVVGGGCGVCEAATVALSLNVAGTVTTDTVSIAPGAQFAPHGAKVFAEFEEGGKSDASLITHLAVTSDEPNWHLEGAGGDERPHHRGALI